MTLNTLKSALLAAGLAFAGTASQAETVLKLASVAPSLSPWGQWAKQVADKIAEKSGGELKIELLLDAQVGDEQTITRQAAKGRIDIAFVSNVPLTLLSEELSLVTAPYLFDTPEQGSCVIHGHLKDIFSDLMIDAGVMPLSWMEVGYFSMFSKEPVKVPSDLAGKKLRVGPAPTEIAFSEKLGTSVVPMGTADVIPALQTGAIDATWFATIYGIAVGTHKLAPNVLAPEHSRLVGAIGISTRVWDKLSDQEKEWLGTFGEMGPQMTQVVLGAEQALLGKIEAAGIPVTRPTGDDLAQWQAAGANVMSELVEQIGGRAAEVRDAIEAAKTACGN